MCLYYVVLHLERSMGKHQGKHMIRKDQVASTDSQALQSDSVPTLARIFYLCLSGKVTACHHVDNLQYCMSVVPQMLVQVTLLAQQHDNSLQQVKDVVKAKTAKLQKVRHECCSLMRSLSDHDHLPSSPYFSRGKGTRDCNAYAPSRLELTTGN